MKAGHVKTKATTEAVSSPPGKNGYWSTKSRPNTSHAEEKQRVGLEKRLVNLWNKTKNEQNYKKGATPVVGQKPNGKSRLKPHQSACEPCRPLNRERRFWKERNKRHCC
jgi:hypothetical protein